MEDLNSLSNEELKYRLTQFGFANLPVTNTTRNVLIKKLRNHMENEKSKLRRETSYATRYSSDEDLTRPDSSKTTQKKRIGITRSTIAAISSQSGRVATGLGKSIMPPPTPSTHTAIASKRSVSGLGGSATSPISLNRSTVYVSPLVQGSSDSDEESDLNTANADMSYSRYNSNVPARPSTASTAYGTINGNENAQTWNRYTTHGIRNRFHGVDEGDATESQNSSPDVSPKSTNGVHSVDDSTALDFTKRLLSFRSRNLGGVSSGSGASVSHNTALNSAKRYNRYLPPMGAMPRPPYLNDSGRSPNMTRDSIVYQANTNTSQNHNGTSRKHPPPVTSTSILTNLINKLDEQYGVRQSFVPCALLSTLVIFFVLVTVMYLTMSPDLSQALDAKAATFKLCQPTSSSQFEEPNDNFNRKTINCIEEVDLDAAFSLLKRLIPELHERIVHNRCKDSTAAFAMSAREIIHFVVEDRPHSVYNAMHALHNAEYLISMNPQWQVAHFADKYATAELLINDVVILREAQTNYLGSVNPRLPLPCMLYKKMQAFFIIIGCLGITLAILYLIVFAYKKVMTHIRSRRDRLNNLIEDITNVLMQKAYDPDTAATEAASVVINHLRDKLIPAAERNRMESTWNEAIRFFEQNESRVQFSVATRNGEDYRVMRWVDTSMPTSRQISSASATGSLTASPVAVSQTPSVPPMSFSTSSLYPRLNSAHSVPSGPSSPTTVKKWQSPAFDKTNKIKDPPTECLKVRQMFDKYEASNPNLKQTIQDAILEKMGQTTCHIYDIQLDKAMCCVYVRCATARDAGLVHDEINGWWFDSRLVSIKFLRLERFMARFPQSTSTVCLKPSNSKNLSMSNCNDGPNGDDGNDDDEYYYNGSG